MYYCPYLSTMERRIKCTAPDTWCEHWQGTFCDLDIEEELKENYINRQEEL